jgi:hypothetical protein
MKCVICDKKLLDTRQKTCYSRLCQKIHKERKQYKNRYGTDKKRKELVKLLKQGCPKKGILMIMNIQPNVLSNLLAPRETRRPSYAINRLIPIDEL